ncbi:MAG: glycosyltransferase family 9 protein [Fimbriimonadaceae bacterium]|nr:glycosyltransferase family 9 protein [Fimbriimonadaceae bacterium]QYK56045.1 MAG: glycosyltransferase family 9 protein [Fimbriimonadaceae bacterium]
MKVLVARFSAIGDCVMTAWAVTALRQALPEARIVWAAQQRCAPVIDTDHLVDFTHIFRREAWKKERWSLRNWREATATYLGLRKEKFDVGLDFQGHSKTALCLALSGAKRKLGSRATDALAEKLLQIVVPPGRRHEVETAHLLVNQVAETTLPVRPLMPKPQPFPWTGDRPLVTVQTGAGEDQKLYPATAWEEVVRTLVARRFHVAVIGAPSDPRLNVEGATDLVGRLSLKEAMGAVAASDLHLAADTGTGHIAAAYGVPVVSVFGPNPAWRFRPYSDRARVLEEGGNPAAVASSRVVEAACELLEARLARPR